MSSDGPDALLSNLVTSIRQVCENNVTFDDFTSVSGLICFDIDGSKQQCFVISELLRKRCGGEGHSTRLKTLNWNNVKKNQSFVLDTNETSNLQNGQEEMAREEDGNISCHSQGANMSAKLDWSNRTFTLKPAQGDESSSANPARNFSTMTITVSRAAHKTPSASRKKDTCHVPGKDTGINRKRQFKRNSFKANSCYPALPKKPIKRNTPYCHENAFVGSTHTKSLRKDATFDSPNPLKKSGMFFSPGEKHTALSWFENALSPSSSLESIDSIQPFYLIPQSEPLLNFSKAEDHDNNNMPGSAEHQRQDHLESQHNRNSARRSQLIYENVKNVYIGNQNESDFPVRSNAPNISSSNATLNTVSSLEQDGKALLIKNSSPHRHTKDYLGEDCSQSSSLEAHTVGSQVHSECSTVAKKRAGLLKWMGLFKKAHKSSSNVPLTKGRTKPNTSNKKDVGGTRKTYVNDPPIEIRLKQWH